MGLRYRKSIRILPGVRLNFSKSGISTSIGKPGCTVNMSNRGTRATVGIPGSGLSYSTSLGNKRNTRRRASRANIEASRAKAQEQYGFTDAEMRSFERKFKRNPRKYLKMSEEKLIRTVRRRGSRKSTNLPVAPRKKRKIIGLVLVFFAIVLIAVIAKE